MGKMPVDGDLAVIKTAGNKAIDVELFDSSVVKKLPENSILFKAERVGYEGEKLIYTRVPRKELESLGLNEAGEGRLAEQVAEERIGNVEEITGARKAQAPVELADGTVKTFAENPFYNSGKLKPDVKYEAGEFDYYYETDSLGRIENFETDDLRLTDRTDRLPHNPNTPGKLPGDHAGHLAGDRFGGSAELDNLVSQSSDLNLREYKKIENQWAKAIKMGKKVKVNVNIKYDQYGLRPTQFIIRYEIDGKLYRKTLIN